MTVVQQWIAPLHRRLERERAFEQDEQELADALLPQPYPDAEIDSLP